MDADFVAFDVETANIYQPWAICQVGFAYFKDGRCVGTQKSYINPGTKFDERCISIHGITPEMVADAASLESFYDVISPHLEGRIIVHHTKFDRESMLRYATKFNKPHIDCTWLDTRDVARATWPGMLGGYGLENLCRNLGIDPGKHHDAQDDAEAAGCIITRAVAISGLPFSLWLDEYDLLAMDGSMAKKRIYRTEIVTELIQGDITPDLPPEMIQVDITPDLPPEIKQYAPLQPRTKKGFFEELKADLLGQFGLGPLPVRHK